MCRIFEFELVSEVDGILFLIKLYIYIIICIYINCVWWNRGGGIEDIDGK